MLILVNGAFGIGKSTLVEGLQRRLPNSLVFDPEWVGYMIRQTVGQIDPRADFQEYSIWQDLVVETVRRIRGAYGQTLILPICLYLPSVMGLPARLREIDPEFHHLLLVAPASAIRARLQDRGDDDGWAASRAETICEVHATLRDVARLDATHLPEDVLSEAFASIGV